MEKDKESKKKQSVPAKPKSRGSIGEYFRGIRTEIKKVVWPTKKELGAYTAVVILTCTFFSILFSIVDTAFLAGLKAILGISL